MHACMLACKHTYPYVNTYMDTDIYIHTHPHTHILAHMHINTRVHVHTIYTHMMYYITSGGLAQGLLQTGHWQGGRGAFGPVNVRCDVTVRATSVRGVGQGPFQRTHVLVVSSAAGTKLIFFCTFGVLPVGCSTAVTEVFTRCLWQPRCLTALAAATEVSPIINHHPVTEASHDPGRSG